MDRSPGFGSNTCNIILRAVNTRFPFGSAPEVLNLLHTLTRRTVLQKVPHRTRGALCACKHKVSGSFSLPARGSFHLSFTVLLHYRSPISI